MFLFAASTNSSYENEKFICVSVRVFAKLDSTGPHFKKYS